MKFYCISDPESADSFRMLNIYTVEVSDYHQASQAFQKIVDIEDAGVVLITDGVSLFIKQEISNFIRKNTQPVILEIPSWKSSAPRIMRKKHEHENR
ncbi:MAG TPA: V-type ATP synthase subunit F [bacterium]|jgi:vacuolar-type H+-ATPase subunit F/Vma7|uniref:V-type ATP synthase subunit F n=1 Tax=candidate division TA06 bacterium ADurb.Bin131 TaxID=1852827 RepID=A0A1V6CE54_UNCT6|nr:MAG: V-type ATP synthase subunit F [candidate division TA06 bacterium ADurb.Bin131]HON05806.1 V-type ATP synthase subunit F [bacterium]HOQ81593.1 V-type ATP synthase subunit F [bacterium]HQL64513.1 V-type ATP synthase subunit F [bacterium]